MFSLFKRDTLSSQVAESLYDKVVRQARLVLFYEKYGVPDSVDGRFEMMCLHLFLIVDVLSQHPFFKDVSQHLFDVAMADFDDCLREMGVGDLSVGRHIKHMAEAFFGRAKSYRQALDKQQSFFDVLNRNVFATKGQSVSKEAALFFEHYMRTQMNHFENIAKRYDFDALLSFDFLSADHAAKAA